MYTQKKPIDNTHIVRERDRRRFRELLAVLCLGIPVGLFLLLFTWQNLEVIRLGREATHLQQRRKEIEDSNKVLRLQLDRLTALDEVERKAAGLGFARTDPKTIVMVAPAAASAPVRIPEAAPKTEIPASSQALVPLPDGSSLTAHPPAAPSPAPAPAEASRTAVVASGAHS